MTERIETVRQISAENLKNGGFVFQLPETATDADKTEFTKAIEDAKSKNLNLVLTPEVKVVDLNAPVVEKKVEVPATPAPSPAPAPVVEKKVEEPKVVEPKKEEPVAQTTQAQPVPTLQQQPMFVMPQQYYQYGQVPFQYNPFIQTPVQVIGPPPQPEQPKPQAYNPVPMVPLNQFNVQPTTGQPLPATPQYVYPQFVAVAAPQPQPPQKTEQKTQQ